MTGGDSGASLDGLSKMFYNPEGYNFLPYKHNCTKDGTTVYTSFFIPAYTFVAQPGYIDNRGVTDTKKAKDYYNEQADKLLSQPKEYIKNRAEFCFTPEDALALEGDNQFNTVLLSDQIARIKLHKLCPHIDHGQLDYKFSQNIHDEEHIDEVKFTATQGGKVHILEHPIRSENGQVPRNLYVAGIDGIDLGGEDTSGKTLDPSDFCVVVLKRAYGTDQPKVVAYYKDRPEQLKTAHMTCLKLLQYYDCKAVVESTRISILQFFRSKHKEDKHLMRRPRSCQSDIQNGRSRQFGAPATEAVIRHQLDLIAQFIDQYWEDMWFVELLEELLKYSYQNKRKFDMVAAFGVCLLGDEELMGIVPVERDDAKNIIINFGYWVDERGYRHKGVIPDRQPVVPNFNLWPTYYDSANGRRSKPID